MKKLTLKLILTLFLTLVTSLLVMTTQAEVQNIASNKEVTQEANILLPVTLRKLQNNQLEASLTELKAEAITSGLHKLVLTGTQTSNSNIDGSSELKIIWKNAYIIQENGEKKSTYLGEYFNSDLIANPELEKGDNFSIEGKASELLSAWQRLMEEDEETTEEEDIPQEEALQPTQNFGGESQEQARDLDFTPPEFVTAEDPVISSTSDGCNINVDIAQMVAIVQERTLQDGKEIAPCSDTLTRYPLEKKYSSCPLSIDNVELKVLEQYTLSYTDPVSSGQIQVQDCLSDEEKSVAINETLDGCAIRHDFGLDKSFQQSRFIYNDKDGIIQEIQACEDTVTAFDHVLTEETCSPVIDNSGGTVTFQNRKKISVDGIESFISDCTPDSNSTVNIQEEACASPRYTHDFATSQSYLNKNYFYMKDSERVDVSNCQQSEVTFPHKQDESQCTPLNDDVNKESTLYAQTYIEEVVGTPIFINNCEAISPKVSYIRLHGLWRKTSNAFNADVQFLGTQGADLRDTFSNLHGCCIGSNQQWDLSYQGSYLGQYPFTDGGNSNCKTWGWYAGADRVSCHWASYKLGKRYCALNSNAGSYRIGGVDVSTTDSDLTPVVTLLSRISKMVFFSDMNMNKSAIEYSCTAKCTQVTYGERNPVYQRGDASTYTDLSITEATKVVCGNGNKFIERTE